MHNIQKHAIVLFLGFNLLASCEKCWDCSFETTISTPDSSIQNVIEETTCLQDEKADWENQGYNCK